MRLFLPLVLLTVTFAGCLESGPDPSSDPMDQLDAFDSAALQLPALPLDVSAAVDDWESFVDGPKRDAYVPDSPVSQSISSRDELAATFEEAGFDVEIRSYNPGAFGRSVPLPAGPAAYAVIAVWPGEIPERIGLIAHYDTQAGTIEGAYDNGSGTIAVVETCKALAKTGLRHTLACVLFDAEEVGTVASRAYVADEVSSGKVTYDLVLGFDMVGINWPGYPDWKLYHFVGAEFAAELHPFVTRVMGQVLHYPEEGNEVMELNDRNSDEASFAAAGVPTVRFAGGRTAGAYDAYHMPNDTPEFVYEIVGGRSNFEAGFVVVMESAWALATLFDQVGPDLHAAHA